MAAAKEMNRTHTHKTEREGNHVGSGLMYLCNDDIPLKENIYIYNNNRRFFVARRCNKQTVVSGEAKKRKKTGTSREIYERDGRQQKLVVNGKQIKEKTSENCFSSLFIF